MQTTKNELDDTPEKIRKTLLGEAKQLGEDLIELSEQFSRNTLIQEVYKLNHAIMERQKEKGIVNVYTPMDFRPFQLVDDPGIFWSTTNPCRVASQVVTGV